MEACGAGLLLTQALTQTAESASPAVNRGNQKGPLQGLHEERMMGLEPTTFCMASVPKIEAE